MNELLNETLSSVDILRSEFDEWVPASELSKANVVTAIDAINGCEDAATALWVAAPCMAEFLEV